MRLVPVLLCGVLTACAAGGPSASPSPAASVATAMPTASPSPTATVVPTASPSATPAPLEDLPANSIATVVVDGLRLRTAPSAGASIVGELLRDADAFVVSGPTLADGYAWYEITGLGLGVPGDCMPAPKGILNCPFWYGWAAGVGPNGEAWLRPSPTRCPPVTDTIAGLFGQQPLLVLSCQGSQPIAVRAYLPRSDEAERLRDWGFFGCVELPGFAPEWLAPCAFVGVLDEPGDEIFFRVWEAPGSGVHLASFAGQTVELVGHFDDPAAANCTAPSEGAPSDWNKVPAQITLMCRQNLVITDIRAADA